MKRILSFFLSAVMVLGIFPVSVLGAKSSQRERVANAANAIHARNIEIKNKEGKIVAIDGSKTAIGILDDGIELGHPALQKPPKNPKLSGGKVILGGVWAPGDSGFSQTWDPPHGLVVTGVAAANGPSTDEPGAKPIQGIAPEAQVIFEKIHETGDQAVVKDEYIAQAMDHAINAGADVINMSFGQDSATMNYSHVLMDAIDSATSRGVVVVSTVGNSGYMGYGKTTPLSKYPDYGVVSSPGMAYSGIGVTLFDNTKYRGRYLTFQGKADYPVVFRQSSKKDYPGLNTYLPYVYVKDPTEENLRQANIEGKFVVVDKYPEGFQGEEGRPPYITMAKRAKALKARGIVIINETPFKYEPFTPFVYDAWNGKWDESEELGNYPMISISPFDWNRLRDLAPQRIKLNTAYGEYDNPRKLDLTDYSSWGVSSDFVFKGDIGAPAGMQTWSLDTWKDEKGTRRYGLKSAEGTSFSAPQVSGAVALVKQRLLEQHPELLKQGNATATLLKNLLLSTALPQTGQNAKGEEVFYSPRAQGNGLLQVREACLTDVVNLSPLSKNAESGAPKTNLGFLKDGKISFQVELQNIGEKPRTFTPILYVMRDEVKDGHFTMKSQYLKDGKTLPKVTVPEARGAELGKKTITVEYTLTSEQREQLEKDCPNGYFLDGYVQFLPEEEDGIELTHSFTGFVGDWFSIPAYETFVYDLKPGEKPFYAEAKARENRQNREGDLNSTHLETFTDGGKYTILGAVPESPGKSKAYSKGHLAISPNGDGNADSVTPVFVMMRDYRDIKVGVKDGDKTLWSAEYGLGVTKKNKNFYGGNREEGFVTESAKDLLWDGLVEGKVKEGLYTYEVAVRPDVSNANIGGSDLGKTQKDALPLKIDITPPALKKVEKQVEGENVKVKLFAEDPNLKGTEIPGSGIFRAQLVTGKGRTPIAVDPLNPKSLEEMTFSIPKEDYDEAKVVLTDWGRNQGEYLLRLYDSNKEGGALSITSLYDNKPLAVSYEAENLATADRYGSLGNLPPGMYEIHPLDLAKGYYLPEAEGEKRLVKVDSKKTTEVTFHYAYTPAVCDVTISPDWDYEDYFKDRGIKVRLTNVETGAVSLLSYTDYAYSVTTVPGTYLVEYPGSTGEDGIRLWNGNNKEIKTLVIDGRNTNYFYTLTAKNATMGQEVPVEPNMMEYIHGQTYLKGTGPYHQTFGVKVYEYDGKGNLKLQETLSQGAKTATVYENSAPSGEDSQYVLDIKDDVVKTIKPGMILQPFTVNEKGEEVLGKNMGIVGPNHLNFQVMDKLIEKSLATMEEGEQKSKLEDLHYDYLSWGTWDPYFNTQVHFTPWAMGSGDQLWQTLMDYRDALETKWPEALRLMNLKEEALPHLRVHGGHFKNVETILRQVWDPNDHHYNGETLMTTEVIAREDLLREVLEDRFKNEIKDGHPLAENLFAVEPLPDLLEKNTFKSWSPGEYVAEPAKAETAADLSPNRGYFEVQLTPIADETPALLEQLKKYVAEGEELLKGDPENPKGEALRIRVNKGKNAIEEKLPLEAVLKSEIRKLKLAIAYFKEEPAPAPAPGPGPAPTPTPTPTPGPIPAPGTWTVPFFEGGGKVSSKDLPSPKGKEEVTVPGKETSTPEETRGFVDIGDYWGKSAIEFVTEKGWFKGVSPNHFAPRGIVTRAQFVTVLGRLTGKTPKVGDTFKDVDKEAYYAPYVALGVKEGFVEGYEDGTFQPDRPVSREEMALILSRFHKVHEQKTRRAKISFSSLKDREEISPWAVDGVKEVVEKGWIQGNERGEFRPKATLTRGELARIIYNIKG